MHNEAVMNEGYIPEWGCTPEAYGKVGLPALEKRQSLSLSVESAFDLDLAYSSGG